MSDDFESFLARLKTFEATDWTGISTNESPIQCSRFGWKCIAFRYLKCETCEAECSLGWDSQNFSETLTDSHKENCPWRSFSNPVEYGQIKLELTEEVSAEFLSRFDAFSVVWDLPKLDCAIQGHEGDLVVLADFLYRRLERSIGGKTEIDDRWKKRVETQMLLALLGWNLHWVQPLVYPEQELQSLNEVRRNDPTTTGICFSRQSYLVCSSCIAQLGLWTRQSGSEIDISEFLRVNCTMNPIKTPVVGIKRKEKEERELDPFSMSTPAFGLKKFASKSPRSVPSAPRPTRVSMRTKADGDFSDCRQIVEGKVLDPINSHRYFCPYLTDWKKLLAKLISD